MEIKRGAAAYREYGLRDVMLKAEGGNGAFSAKDNSAAEFIQLTGKLGVVVDVEVPISWALAVVKAAGYRVFKEV